MHLLKALALGATACAIGRLYLYGQAAAGEIGADPSAYPGCSDPTLAKFPPTLFLSGTRALDLSPSVAAHAHLLKLDVDSSLYIIEGGWHSAQDWAEGSPEKHDANAYMARWFRQHLGN